MTKTDLIEEIASTHEITKTKAKMVVNDIFDGIIGVVMAGGGAKIRGFGTFSRIRRAASDRVNPKTRESVSVPACGAVKFTPSKAFKNYVK